MDNSRNRRRLSRDELQALTRERLLEATRDLVAERGIGGASVRDIAEAAGYSQGAFYSNFQRKEDILIELLRRHMADVLAELENLLQRAKEAPQQALATFEHWVRENSPDAVWSVIEIELQLHASRNAEFGREYDALNAAKRRALGHILQGVFALLGKSPPAPPETIAASLLALSHASAAMRGADGKDAAAEAVLLYLRSLIALAR